MSDQIHCPKCNSTQCTANKKGFSGGKAAAGVVLTGGVGLLAGTIGSNKIIITCLACGYQFKPGDKSKAPIRLTQKNLSQSGNFGMIFGLIFMSLGVITLISGGYIFGGIILLIGIFLFSMYFSNLKQIRQMREDEELRRNYSSAEE